MLPPPTLLAAGAPLAQVHLLPQVVGIVKQRSVLSQCLCLLSACSIYVCITIYVLLLVVSFSRFPTLALSCHKPVVCDVPAA